MARLGILFDIDALGAADHAVAAYRILFAALDTSRIPGAVFSDGDTGWARSGVANLYCIAVESPEEAHLRIVREALARVEGHGVVPLWRRFLQEPALSREPLVTRATVGSGGELTDASADWVVRAWNQTRRSDYRGGPVPCP